MFIIYYLETHEHLWRSTGNLENTFQPHALLSQMYIALPQKKHGRCILLFMDFLLNFWTLKWLNSTLSFVEIRWTLVQYGQSFLMNWYPRSLSQVKKAWPPNCPTTKRPDRTNAVRTNSPCSSPALSTWRLASWETHFQRSDSGGILGLESFKYSCRVELMVLSKLHFDSWVGKYYTMDGNLLVMLLFFWYLLTKIRPCLGGLFALFDLLTLWRFSKATRRSQNATCHPASYNIGTSSVPLGSKQWHWVGPRFPAKSLSSCASGRHASGLAMTEKDVPLYSEQHFTRSSSCV